ncbi:MAG: sugar transferase, partial [Bacteroidota bacterium]|nr:sugar transferase [Bacteroidota bacterium]
MKNVPLQVAKYVFFDALGAMISYFSLFSFRKYLIENQHMTTFMDILDDESFIPGIITTTLFWVLLYWIAGHYKDIYRRSRLKEIFQTFSTNVFGSIIIFFVLILDDWVNTYKDYYQSFFVYLGVLFFFTALFRFILSTRINNKIQSRKIWFNTLLVGSNENALELYRELESQRKSTGNRFIGFVSVYEKLAFLVEKELPLLGSYRDIGKLMESHDIEEVIIAIESSEHSKLEEIINDLEDSHVRVKMIPDTYDIISGQVRLESLGAPLIEIKHELMPTWQLFAKRAYDIVISLIVMILLSPLFIFTGIMVKATSPGPIFFRQKRVGLHGKPFNIIKFRSMYQDAEKNGPQLSSEEDERITPWGKVMRKYRLDELPQFFN